MSPEEQDREEQRDRLCIAIQDAIKELEAIGYVIDTLIGATPQVVVRDKHYLQYDRDVDENVARIVYTLKG